MERCIRYIAKEDKQSTRQQVQSHLIHSTASISQGSLFIIRLWGCMSSNENEHVERHRLNRKHQGPSKTEIICICLLAYMTDIDIFTYIVGMHYLTEVVYSWWERQKRKHGTVVVFQYTPLRLPYPFWAQSVSQLRWQWGMNEVQILRACVPT